MTDGSQSQSDLSKHDLVRMRKQEAEDSAQILGINRCMFLDYPDRQLKKNEIDENVDLISLVSVGLFTGHHLLGDTSRDLKIKLDFNHFFSARNNYTTH